MTELTFTLLKYGFLVLLWIFVFLAIRALHSDITMLSGRSKSTKKRAQSRWKLRKNNSQVQLSQDSSQLNGVIYGQTVAQENNAYTTGGNNALAAASQGGNVQYAQVSQSQPMLLVVIDGPFAGMSTPLTQQPITLGRDGRNTVVLDDEFVSSYHAHIYQDPATCRWVIEDLGSTNGTYVNGKRIDRPTFLPSRMPVRIGATTLELR